MPLDEMQEPEMITAHGGCHCGAVRFEVKAPLDIEIDDCDCSICAKTGFLHLITPASRFRLVSGREALRAYTFGTGVAKHMFCEACGIKSFYVPRSNPDGFSVNFRCLDTPQIFRSVRVISFAGAADWDAAAAAIADKSREQ